MSAPLGNGTCRRLGRAVSPAVAALAAALGVALVAVGCSGEARPLEEAVEVGELGLGSLRIVPPEGTLMPLYVNAGQRVAFALEGTGRSGDGVDVDGTDRDWRVSDSAVASIDDAGVLVARADGPVAVEVRIGDIAAAPFDLVVRTAALETIDEIRGEGSVDPCIAERYVATGGFNDGTTRSLSSVDWSTPGTTGVRLEPQQDGSVLFTGREPTTVQLTAASGPASLAVPVVVTSSLVGIEIGPATRAADVGDTFDLGATGTYADADGTERTATITDGVEWNVVDGGTAFASVSNEASSRGRVSARAVGETQIGASCGSVSDVASFTVNAEPASADDDELVFENAEDGVLSLFAGESVQLRVSRGESFDTDDEVTGDVGTLWTLLNPDDGYVALTTDGLDQGFLTAIAPGRARIQVTNGGDVADLIVEVRSAGL